MLHYAHIPAKAESPPPPTCAACFHIKKDAARMSGFFGAVPHVLRSLPFFP